MTNHEKRTLWALDREVEAHPQTVAPRKLRQYRQMLIRHIAETCAGQWPESRRAGTQAAAPGAPGLREDPPGVAMQSPRPQGAHPGRPRQPSTAAMVATA